MSRAIMVPFALLCLVAGGCGGGDKSSDKPINAVPSAARSKVVEAQNVDLKKFPAPDPGQTLDDFAKQFNEGAQAVPATGVLTTPENRLAFGLLDDGQQFVYGASVLYVQKADGDGEIEGPIAAPADVLLTEPRYRSQQAATEKSPFAAIYEAKVPFPTPGVYNVLVVSDVDGNRQRATLGVQVKSKDDDKIPDVGEQAPKVETDTKGSVKGKLSLLDTRIPPAPELAENSFADVVGKKPVALLFSTPQLCASRVCGPVTDEMLQLKAKYGDQMDFIHQEVYNGNQIDQGIRPPLAKFGLRSEPWLFTVRKDGTIAARLEGSIGLRAFEDAIKAALK